MSRARSRRNVERRLCAEAGESAGVGDVGARLSVATAATGTSVTTAFATATSTTTLTTTAVTTTATTLTTTERTTALAAAAAAAVTASTAGTTLTGRGSKHAVTIELDVDLLLALTLTLSLAAGTSEEVLLLAGDLGALGEVLGAALVGLAEVLLTELELLLSQLGEVGSVGLGVVLGLGLSLSLGVLLDGLLLLLLSDGLTGLLVSEFGLAGLGTPAVSSLLLVLTVEGQRCPLIQSSIIIPDVGPAVTVTLLTGGTTTATTGTTTGATAATATTATTLLRLWKKSVWLTRLRLDVLTARTTAAVAAGADVAIPKSYVTSVHAQDSTSPAPIVPLRGWYLARRTVVVGVVALLGAALVALALNGGSGLDVGAVALAVPGGRLVDGLCRWLSWPVGVELGVVACGVMSEFSRGGNINIAYPAARTCSVKSLSAFAPMFLGLRAPH